MDKKNIEIVTNTKQVGRWLSRIELASKVHEDKFADNAKTWRDFYEGNHFPKIANKSDLVVINYTYSILKAILPQIYFQDPYIYLTAESGKFVGNRQLAEDSLNHTWREIKAKRNMKRIILDMLVMGLGIGKEGYWFKTERPERLETQAEFTEFVKEEYPYFLRQSPFDVVFDFEAKSLDEIRWLAARYYVPLEELKEKYPKGAKKFKGNFVAGELSHTDIANSGVEQEYEDDLKRVEIWEISDLVDRKIHVVTDENKDDFLDSFDNPYEDLTNNWKILYVNEIPDKLYPLSDVSNLKDINLWMDKVNSMLMTDIMKSQRKILYEEDAFADDEEMQKFLSGEDLQKVKLSSGAIAGEKILVVNASIIPQDFYNNNELCKDHLNNVSGVGNNQRGVSDNVDRRTKFEAQVMDRNAQLRNSERLDTITDYCISVAEDLLTLMQKFGSKDTEFYNEKRGNQVWNKDKIAGKFKPKIDIGSTVKRDSESERQMIMQFGAQLMQVTDDNGVPIVDKRKFAKLCLEKFGISIEDINEVMLSNDEFLAKVAEGASIENNIQIIQAMAQAQLMKKAGLQGGQAPVQQGVMPEQSMQPQEQMPVEAMPPVPPMGNAQAQSGIQLTPEEMELLGG